MLYCYFNIESIRDRFAPYQERFFMDYYIKEKMYDPICAEMIKDVDNSVLIPPFHIESPVLGLAPIDDLSGGVKTLLLLYMRPEFIFRSRYMGDNCAKSLLKLSEVADCHLLLEHVFRFDDKQVITFPQYGRTVVGRQGARSIIRDFADDFDVEGPDVLRGCEYDNNYYNLTN